MLPFARPSMAANLPAPVQLKTVGLRSSVWPGFVFRKSSREQRMHGWRSSSSTSHVEPVRWIVTMTKSLRLSNWRPMASISSARWGRPCDVSRLWRAPRFAPASTLAHARSYSSMAAHLRLVPPFASHRRYQAGCALGSTTGKCGGKSFGGSRDVLNARLGSPTQPLAAARANAAATSRSRAVRRVIAARDPSAWSVGFFCWRLGTRVSDLPRSAR
mmetsp:Transcript_3166/g.9278  ORF Transcript_3166/g.9278 Transcript_3166/m.9278 type:complete len:216 (+) Transcript_3166:736-1383(+)